MVHSGVQNPLSLILVTGELGRGGGGSLSKPHLALLLDEMCVYPFVPYVVGTR